MEPLEFWNWVPWMSSDLTHYFLNGKLRMRDAKELTWKCTVRPLLAMNWLGGYSHHLYGGRTDLLSWTSMSMPTLVWTCSSPQTPLHHSPGRSKAFYLEVEVFCGNVPMEDVLRQSKCCLTNLQTWKDCLVAKYQAPSLYPEWWSLGLSFLSGCNFEGCDFGKELHCL